MHWSFCLIGIAIPLPCRVSMNIGLHSCAQRTWRTRPSMILKGSGCSLLGVLGSLRGPQTINTIQHEHTRTSQTLDVLLCFCVLSMIRESATAMDNHAYYRMAIPIVSDSRHVIIKCPACCHFQVFQHLVITRIYVCVYICIYIYVYTNLSLSIYIYTHISV
jgi:hypothetical protein